MDFPDLPKISAAVPAAPVALAPAGAAAPPADHGPKMIPRMAWREHVQKNAKSPERMVAALPDGTPLRLTAAGVQFYEMITGTVMFPRDFREAAVLLWAASLTEDEEEALWMPRAPLDGDAEASVIPGLAGEELTRYFSRWQRAVIPPAASVVYDVQTMAQRLWDIENGTALELDDSALPEDEDPGEAEKKSIAAGLTGFSPPSTPSAEEIPASGATCSTAFATAPSSPPTEHGSPGRDGP